MIDPRQVRQVVRDFQYALVRYHRPALMVFGGVVAATFIGLIFMPRSYESEAKVYVRFGRENSVDPTASGQMVSIYESRESEVNSLLEILSSRAVLLRVVEELGPDYILHGRETKPSPEISQVDASRAAKPKEIAGAQPTSAGTPERNVQQALLKLQQQLEAWSPKKTNTIAVNCRAETPERAQRILATLLKVYMDAHVRVHQTTGSYEFFVEQERVYEHEWREAAAALRKSKDAMGIVTIEGKRKLLQDQIQDIETKLMSNRSDLATSQARMASLRATLDTLPERVVTQTMESANSAADGMQQTLYQAQSKLHELTSTHSDTHPKVIAMREQIDSMKQILDRQQPTREQTTEGANPQRQALELSLLQEQSQADALQGREKTLLAQQQELQKDLRRLNAEEIRIAELQREVDMAESRYRTYDEKLEQARINRSLDEERISSLSVIQPATYPAKPLGPRKLYVLALGMFVALGAGIGLVVGLSYWNPVLQSVEQVEFLLETPVLGVTPASVRVA